MKIPRKSNEVSEIVEALDQRLLLADGDVRKAWDVVKPDELAYIDRELERVITDRRYYMENYHVITDENGRLQTLSPWWDHQEIIWEIAEREWDENGCLRAIILKPRQCGGTVWTAGLMFHATVFTPQAFTLLMAHDEEASAEIDRRVRVAFDNLPWWMRPDILSRQQERHWIFQRPSAGQRVADPGLGSTLLISNAQRKAGIAIGRTIKNAHFCLSSNNFIFKANGFVKSIAEAQLYEGILAEGKGVRVKAFSVRDASTVYPGAENGYRIIPWCNAAFPIEGTGNHSVLAADVYTTLAEKKCHHKWIKQNPRLGAYKKVRDVGMKELHRLTPKDCLAVPVRPITSDGDLPPAIAIVHRQRGKQWIPPTPTHEFGFAIGLYLAEGNVSNPAVNITLDSDEQDLADRFAAAVKIPYGKVRENPGTRTRHYLFNCASMQRWFKLYIGGLDQKRIPLWAWTLGREFLLGIVEGLILGDGHVHKKQPTIHFHNVLPQLTIGLREAVSSLRFGYGGIHTQPAGIRYGRNRQQIWSVVFCHTVDEILRKQFGWKLANCNKKLSNQSHWYYSEDHTRVYIRIRKVERVLLDKVYDIEVDSPEHTYLLPAAITHNSEVSRYPDASIYTADIKPSMNARDILAIMESTAYGRNGLFFNQWRAAESGKSAWTPIFIPVYRVRKYYLPLPKGQTLELTAEERQLRVNVKAKENFTIPLSFFNWKRNDITETINSTGSDEDHYEAYPTTPGEAFISSGFCAFPKRCLNEQEKLWCVDPALIGEIEYTGVESDPILRLHPPMREELLDKPSRINRLWLWEYPDSNDLVEYFISGDIGGGAEGNDFTDVAVYRLPAHSRDSMDLVAEWHGLGNPSHIARIIAALGYWYHTAEIAVEYMKAGVTTGDELFHQLDYPSIYRWKNLDKVSGSLTLHIHWLTNSRTRDDAINRMNERLLDRTIKIRNKHTIEEMRDFGRLEGDGRAEGLDNNDDMVMANIINVCASHQSGRMSSDAPSDSSRSHLLPRAQRAWGVYDHLMRQIDQTDSEEVVKKVLADAAKKYNGKVEEIIGKNSMSDSHPRVIGWRVALPDLSTLVSARELMVMEANTPWSPIHDSSRAEHELHYKHGVPERQVLPEIVQIYREILTTQHYEGDD